MALIKNIEENIKFVLCLNNNDMLDYDSDRDDFENWIPFNMKLVTPNKDIEILDDVKLTFTLHEINKLLCCIDEVMQGLILRKKLVREYYHSECSFGMRFETIIEDDVIEVELWMNMGIITNGRIFGYDDGIRFISNNIIIKDFYDELRIELSDIAKK